MGPVLNSDPGLSGHELEVLHHHHHHHLDERGLDVSLDFFYFLKLNGSIGSFYALSFFFFLFEMSLWWFVLVSGCAESAFVRV